MKLLGLLLALLVVGWFLVGRTTSHSSHGHSAEERTADGFVQPLRQYQKTSKEIGALEAERNSRQAAALADLESDR